MVIFNLNYYFDYQIVENKMNKLTNNSLSFIFTANVGHASTRQLLAEAGNAPPSEEVPQHVLIQNRKFTDLYEIGKEIGIGTYASVYTCYRKTDSHEFAVKII
eukprot:345061_1